MRVSVFGVEMTIPNKLLDKLDEFDYDKLSNDEKELFNAVSKLVTKGKVIITDGESNKRKNAKKATTVKVNKTIEKIQNAVNLLKLQGEEVNPYKIAKIANVSYNTARKYFKLYYEMNS
jgi:Fic family protein